MDDIHAWAIKNWFYVFLAVIFFVLIATEKRSK